MLILLRAGDRRRIVRVRVIGTLRNSLQSIPCLLPGNAIQLPSIPRSHRARSIGSLIGKKKRTYGGGWRERTEEKVSEKRCLRPAHQTLFHGGDPPRSIPVRKASLTLALALSLSFFPRDAPSLALSSPRFRLPYRGCLAKTRRLSLKVTRQNRHTSHTCVQKGCQAKRGGGRRRRFTREWMSGGKSTRQTVRACMHCATDTAENPLKESTRNKGHSSPVSSSATRHLSLSLCACVRAHAHAPHRFLTLVFVVASSALLCFLYSLISQTQVYRYFSRSSSISLFLARFFSAPPPAAISIFAEGRNARAEINDLRG